MSDPFVLDPRIRGIPVPREQVTAVHRSLNTPHLAIPGRQAGPGRAFVVGIDGSRGSRGASGLNVLVYLFLSEAGDCAVYTSKQRNLDGEHYAELEGEALAFVESLGFMMDNLNFQSLAVAEQEELMKSLPVFGRDPRVWAAPPPVAKANKPEAPVSHAPSYNAGIGRLLSTF